MSTAAAGVRDGQSRAARAAATRALAAPATRAPLGGAGRAPAPARPPQEDLTRAAEGFAILWLEVERGWRPLRQLRRLVSAELLDRLEQLPRRGGPPSRVRRCSGMRVGSDAYEAVVVLTSGDRTTALCLTLRRAGPSGPWRVTDLATPEAGPLPPPRYTHPADLPVCGVDDDGRAPATDWCSTYGSA